MNLFALADSASPEVSELKAITLYWKTRALRAEERLKALVPPPFQEGDVVDVALRPAWGRGEVVAVWKDEMTCSVRWMRTDPIFEVVTEESWETLALSEDRQMSLPSIEA